MALVPLAPETRNLAADGGRENGEMGFEEYLEAKVIAHGHG